MTIAELRELLANYPQDLPVMVEGYEGGFDDVTANNVATKQVRLEVNPEWYYGRHDIPDTAEYSPEWRHGVQENGPVVTALILCRDWSRQNRTLVKQPEATPAS